MGFKLFDAPEGMKLTAIWVDMRNEKMMEWYNKVKKLAIMVNKQYIYEAATGKKVGFIAKPLGPFARTIIKQADQFIDNPVTVGIVKD